jgi:DNA-binding protein HU-beta
MTKPELIALLASKSEVGKNDVALVLDALTDVVKEEVLAKGDQVSIPGLGIFKQKRTAPRTGRNPQTGASMEISAKTKVVFAPASALKV